MTIRKGRRWHRTDAAFAKDAVPPAEFPDVMFTGPYFEKRDTWIGLFWEHSIQGWDGGWFESWRFYVVLIPTIVFRINVDRSGHLTRAYRQWRQAQLRGLP